MSSPFTDAQRAHLVLRATLGLNLLGHGLVRIPHAGAFADKLVRDFEPTMLPAFTVRPFALVLPFVELAVGAFVLLGLRLRDALVTGGIVIAMLTFGTCLQQQWESAGLQLIYAIAYAILLFRAADARLTLDSILGARHATT